MSTERTMPAVRHSAPVGNGGSCHWIERGLLSLALALMVLVPTVEILLRGTRFGGLYPASLVEQHLGLVVAMLGAMVASKENRLLSMSVLPDLLSGWPKHLSDSFTALMGSAVSLVLALSSARFVLAERESGATLAFTLPTWWIQAMMPIGFTVIAWRLTDKLRSSAPLRFVTFAVAGLLAATMSANATGFDGVTHLALLALGMALVCGTPLFAVIGGVALVLFWAEGIPLAAMSIDQYRMVVNPTLPAIPLFTLAGFFLSESRAPERLIRFFVACFGRSRSSASAVAVLTGTLMTSFTGASGVTILALGGLLLPMLLRWNYPRRSAIGVTTGAGLPGILLAPSLPLILYAVIAEVGVEEMFRGALPAACLMAALVFLWSRTQGKGGSGVGQPFSWREVWSAFLAAKWELALPVVAIGTLFSGLATPVEAAAITALYAFIVEVIVHRDIRIGDDLVSLLAKCGALVGGILLILGVALGLTNYLVDAQVPDMLLEWVRVSVDSRWEFLLWLNLFLVLAGCLMDAYAAIIILTPIIVPLARMYGIDPLHLGVIFLANLELGYLTPPVGINLFYAASRFDQPLLDVSRSVVSLIPVLAVGVLIITYFPALSRLLL